MDVLPFMSIGFCLFFFLVNFSAALDSITQNQTLTKPDTLISKNGSFELGFFSPSTNSEALFLGIWNKNKSPLGNVVWVANQHNPIKDITPVLKINDSGNAILLGQNNSVLWSTNSSKQAQNPVFLQLLDSGSLVLRDENGVLWQSFDFKMEKSVLISSQTDQCDDSGYCGPNGICDITKSPVCSCPKGFKAKSQETVSTMDFSSGCVRNKDLNCGRSDFGFNQFGGVRLPDGKNSWVNKSLNLDQCREKCLKNCSCTAYASSNSAEGGVGCTIWLSDLIGVREALDDGQNLFIKVDSSEITGM